MHFIIQLAPIFLMSMCCCVQLPDIKVSLALWKIVTHIHMLSKIIVVKRGKIGVDWKIWLKFLPLQNTIQKKATMPELLYSIGFQRRENTVSNREKVCKAWVVPCRQALLCMMDVRIKNRRDFFLYPSSIRGVIISKLPFDIWPRRRWIFRLHSSASSGINYSADLDV